MCADVPLNHIKIVGRMVYICLYWVQLIDVYKLFCKK